jgi:hypothetical protein
MTVRESMQSVLRNAVVCRHCHGKGECFCETCAPSRDLPGSYRDDFDSGRQEEGTCSFCGGLGRTEPDGTMIEF